MHISVIEVAQEPTLTHAATDEIMPGAPIRVRMVVARPRVVPLILWLEKILHHLRHPRMMIPL